MAERATAFLASEPELYLADLVVAETVYVLESFYKAPREQVAEAMRSLAAMRSMITVDSAVLLRAIKVYEIDRPDVAAAYLVAVKRVADAIGAAVAHREFAELDAEAIARKAIRGGCFVDVKSRLDAAALRDAGLTVWRL